MAGAKQRGRLDWHAGLNAWMPIEAAAMRRVQATIRTCSDLESSL